MRYKISFDNYGKDNILVEDIVESKERLFEGYDTRYGVNVKKIISKSDFFLALRSAVLGCDTIIDMECEANEYKIDWLEIKDGVSVMHYDSFELDSNDRDFIDSFKLWEKMFKMVAIPTRKRVIEKRSKYASSDDIFKRCVDTFYSFSKDCQWSAIDPKVATEMYKFIQDHPLEFQGFPSQLSKGSEKEIKLYIITKIIISISALYNLPFYFMNDMAVLGLVLMGGYGLIAFRWCGSKIVNIKREWKNKAFKSFIDELEKSIDADYLKNLNKDIVEDRPFGLVDVLNKMIAKDENSSILEALLMLAVEYSTDKCSEMDGGLAVDKFAYVDRLLDLEFSMYHQDKTGGLLKRSPRVTVEHLYEILEVLGWDKRTILCDNFLRNVISCMKGLIESPYEGVEAILIEMIVLAKDYVEWSMANDKDWNMEKFQSELDRYFSEAVANYNEAVSLERRVDEVERQSQVTSPTAPIPGEIVKQMRLHSEKTALRNF